MRDLKPISHIQFNEFIKGKGFKGRSNYKSKDLKAMFSFKPLYDRRSLVISSEDMEPTEFGSMRKAAEAIRVSKGSIRYAKKNGKTSLRTPVLRCFSSSGANSFAYKMPHSNFKERYQTFHLGVGKCPVAKPLTLHRNRLEHKASNAGSVLSQQKVPSR